MKPMVLVVDDDADLRRTIALLLGRAYDIAEAGDGLEALDAAKARRPDLVLLDANMPTLGVVDDCADLRRTVGMLLAGHEIVEAANGEARDFPLNFHRRSSILAEVL